MTTYLGTPAQPDVIAVDPNVIPLGSRVYLEYPDGGAIKGSRINIVLDSGKAANTFGIQNVKVYVAGEILKPKHPGFLLSANKKQAAVLKTAAW
ncbi:3D domain-containing protein [Dendrosporobacter quercicolus]|nr:3D domain-containing protein [Dendrosporobacter quercicolus]